MITRFVLMATVSALLLTPAATRSAAPMEGRPIDGPMTPDIPATFNATTPAADYDRREVMIPMRDGQRLSAYLYFPPGQGPWPDSALIWPAAPASTNFEPQAAARSAECSSVA